MKRLIGFVALAVALGTVPVVHAQKDNRTGTNEEIAHFLTDMTRQWLQANTTHDPSILEKILADDYQNMHPTGRFSTKSEEIAQIKSSKCKVESDHLDDARVRVFGDVAVLYGWETFAVQCPDKVHTGTYFWRDVWLKRGGRWQAFAGMEPDPMAVSPLLPPESKPVAASGASGAVYVQKENRAETNDEVVHILIDKARQSLEGNMTHNPSIEERDLADDYQNMRPTGRFSTKSEEIEIVKHNPNSSFCKLLSDHLDEAKVRVFGDAAVLYVWETFVAKCNNKVKTGTYLWGDLWLKRNGRWQDVAGIEPDPTEVSPLLPPESIPVK